MHARAHARTRARARAHTHARAGTPPGKSARGRGPQPITKGAKRSRKTLVETGAARPRFSPSVLRLRFRAAGPKSRAQSAREKP
eukprot:4353181-Alexandrium_andersonii.AAC.1